MDKATRKVEEASKKLHDVFGHIPDLSIMIISEKKSVIIEGNRFHTSVTADDFGIGLTFQCNRKDILDNFCKLEYLLNQLIRLKLLGFEYKIHRKLNDILEYMQFFLKIRLLHKNWNVINNSLYGRLINLKDVRNDIAHQWDIEQIEYKSKPLKLNFEQYRKDLKKIWQDLIEIYSVEQEKIDIDGIIEFAKNEL